MKHWKYLPQEHKFTSETIPEIEWDEYTDELSEVGKKAFIRHLRARISKLRLSLDDPPGLDSILWQVSDVLGISPMIIIHELFPQIADEYEIVFVPKLVKKEKRGKSIPASGGAR